MELRTSVLAEIASIMDNEDLLRQALDALRNLKKKEAAAPCRFTEEEMKHEIKLAEEDDRLGRFYSSDELRKKHPLCR